MKKDAEIAAVFGSRGSGKSTMARHIVKSHKRVLVLDPTNDWQSEGPYKPVDNIADLARMLRAAWKRKTFRIVYNVPHGRYPEALHHVSNLLCQYQQAYFDHADDRKLTLVVEEMAEAYSNAAANRRDLPGFSKVVLQGRHYGLEVVGVSQRPHDIAARFRDNAATVYVFALVDHNSRDAIARMTGPEYREQIRTLANYRFLKIRGGDVSTGRLTIGKSRK